MNFFNFFREDSGEILGVYCDGEKLFLARLNDKLETTELEFQIANDDNSAVEQLAQKIKFFCNQNLLQNPKISLILRDGAAATFQTEFKNIPANEIEDAVKIWAVAHVGKEARYTSIKRGEEIWMEALPASIVEEYVSAFEKNSLQLCNLTEFPTILADADRPPTPYNRAIFAADILKNKKPPNVLYVEVSTQNTNKILLTAAAIFFIAVAGFSAKLSYDYFNAATRTETAQNRFNSQNDTFTLMQDFDAVKARLKRFDAAISNQNINNENLGALIKIGKLYDGKIILDKIKATGETVELEGVAESPDAVKLYLSRLKNFVSPKVKLKNSTEDDGQIIFSISISLGVKE